MDVPTHFVIFLNFDLVDREEGGALSIEFAATPRIGALLILLDLLLSRLFMSWALHVSPPEGVPGPFSGEEEIETSVARLQAVSSSSGGSGEVAERDEEVAGSAGTDGEEQSSSAWSLSLEAAPVLKYSILGCSFCGTIVLILSFFPFAAVVDRSLSIMEGEEKITTYSLWGFFYDCATSPGEVILYGAAGGSFYLECFL